MRDDIDLLAPGLLENLLYFDLELSAAVLDCARTVMSAVENDCSVCFQLFGNPSPIIQMIIVSEKDSVYQKQRVFSLTDLCVLALFISLSDKGLKSHFL